MVQPSAHFSVAPTKWRVYTIAMDTTVLNYRIIISPDTRTGTDKPCFSAYCPTLGVVDDGDTVEEAIAHIKKAIKAYLESLDDDKIPVPVDHPTQMVTTAQIRINRPLSFA